MKVINKINKRLEHVTDYSFHQALFVGSDIDDFFLTSFDFPDYMENFAVNEYDEMTKPKMIIIVGHVNLNQTLRLKAIYESLPETQRKVIQVKSPSVKFLNNNSYFLSKEQEGLIPIDLVYDQLPINFKELDLQIRQLDEA